MKDFCVYEHKFPDGKSYIGITSDSEKRWRNGQGYSKQPKIYDAIKRFGWDNIEHNIVVDGLTKEQAQKLEKYLIGKLNTITNGYNVSIGGGDVSGTYLDSRLLDFCREAHRYNLEFCPIKFSDGKCISVSKWVYDHRFNKEESAFWNDAYDAVCKKHGVFRCTNFDSLFSFWWHMRELWLLDIAVSNGHDVSNWTERPVGCFIPKECET